MKLEFKLLAILFTIVQQENFEGENFRDFKVLWLFVKVFSVKFGGVTFLAEQFSPQKLYFLPIHENFLPRKFPTIS